MIPGMIPSINPKLLKKYVANIFIESGTCFGDSVQIALDLGFNEIRSIELDESRHRFCKDRFFNQPRIKLVHGDSSIKFKELLDGIVEPATIWLDAHYCNVLIDTKGNNYPLLMEIDQIVDTKIPHLILIDDTTLLPTFKTPPEQIIRRLDLLGEYEYRLEDKGRVMVCEPKGWKHA